MRVALIVVGSVVGAGVLLMLVGLVVARLRAPSAGEIRLGVREGRLTPCPGTPNCVSTMAGDEAHRVEPIPYEGPQEQALESARRALATLSRTRLIEEGASYLRAESRSRIFRFVDDVEVYLPPGEGIIHFRSASRVGQGDLGANRRRYERFREALDPDPALSSR